MDRRKEGKIITFYISPFFLSFHFGILILLYISTTQMYTYIFIPPHEVLSRKGGWHTKDRRLSLSLSAGRSVTAGVWCMFSANVILGSFALRFWAQALYRNDVWPEEGPNSNRKTVLLTKTRSHGMRGKMEQLI